LGDQNAPQDPAGPPWPGAQEQSSAEQPVSPQPQAYQPPQEYTWPAHGNPPWPWPSQGAWPGPTAPTARPSRVRGVVTGAIVALAAALIAGAIGYEIGTHHSRISAAVQSFKAAAAGPCPVGVASPDPSAISPTGAALLARMLATPSGDKQGTGQEETRVLSLRDYVNLLYTDNPAEQQRLIALCFQTAVHREWVSPGGTITAIWLIQFGTAADARSYTLATEQADASDPANTDVFRVAQVPDGMGLGRPKLDQYGNTLTRLLGDAGNTSMIVHIYVPARTDNAAAAVVLQEQNARLTAASS
jgi:hypothetical protein